MNSHEDFYDKHFKDCFTRGRWKWFSQGREMMSQNAQQIDYIFASRKLDYKKGRILNSQQLINSDRFPVCCTFMHARIKFCTTQFRDTALLKVEKRTFVLICLPHVDMRDVFRTRFLWEHRVLLI